MWIIKNQSKMALQFFSVEELWQLKDVAMRINDYKLAINNFKHDD